MAAELEEAAGTVCWWGLSPAIDLRLHLPPDPDPAAEASVLLVGAAEGRHLLMTAARARRGPPESITLFVTEQSPEPVARQLLFLLLALERPNRASPEARAAAILELFGSGRLRARTAALLRGAAGRLRRWVGSERHREPGPERSGPAELGLMKCRDRDALEAVLRRWEQALPVPGSEPGPVPGSEPGPVPGLPGWEQRLRRRLGARYESRAAVADWELRMALQPRGAVSLSPAEFGLWRESGDAFGGGGGGAATPNPTLLSDPRPRADGRSRFPPRFWGDIATGPFLSFGLERRRPGQTATEVSLGAVTALLRELLTGEPPKNSGDPPKNSGDPPKNSGDPPENNRDPPENNRDPQKNNRDPPENNQDPPRDDSDPLGPLAPLPVRVRFLPLGDPPATPARLGGLCRLLVLGWRSLGALGPSLGALAAPEATLLLELPTFVPSLRPPDLAALRARAEALARGGGFEPWGEPGEPPGHARFRRGRPPHGDPSPN